MSHIKVLAFSHIAKFYASDIYIYVHTLHTAVVVNYIVM